MSATSTSTAMMRQDGGTLQPPVRNSVGCFPQRAACEAAQL